MIFLVEKKDNKVDLNKVINYFLGANDGQYEVEIEKQKKTRTLMQNRYYWLYLKIIADETGDNEMDLHEFFKRKCLPPRFVKVLGREVKLPASTTRLSKSEFSFYISAIEEITDIKAPATETYLYA